MSHRRLIPALLCLALLGPAAASADPGVVAEVTPEARDRSIDPRASLELDRTVHLGAGYVVESLTVTAGNRVVLQEGGLEPGLSGRVPDRESVRVDLAPGDPTLRVDAVLRGKGTGDFAWLSNYTLDVSSLCPVELFRGATTRVVIELTRRAGPFADFGEGIEVECRSSVQPD